MNLSPAQRNRRRKRATVLFLVVTLLALLFVIVTGFLNVARSGRVQMQQRQTADNRDAAIDAIIQSVKTELANQFVDARGEQWGGAVIASDNPADPNVPAVKSDVAFEDIPGGRGGMVLSSMEPTLPGNAIPGGLTAWDWWQYPSTSTLPGDVPAGATANGRGVTLAAMLQLVGNDPPFIARQPNDQLAIRALLPLMDADGDGFPDALPARVASATAIANAVSGSPVSMPSRFFDLYQPGVTMQQIGGNGQANYQRRNQFSRWQTFNERANVVAPVRLISNGGMVTLDADRPNPNNDPYPWNTAFAVSMFNWVRADGGGLMPNDLQNLGASNLDVEMALRRRFMLPGYFEPGDPQSGGTPAVLRDLEARFPVTFGVNQPTRNAGRYRLPTWQRYDLTSEAGLWAERVALRPGGNLANYDRRHLMTMINYSDDLARKASPEPNPTQVAANAVQLSGVTVPLGINGIYPGALKFYLGDVAKAFNPTTLDYFSNVLLANETNTLGPSTVRNIANRFYDFLNAYRWGGANDEAIDSPRTQALMMGVNTVAFAAPRANDGFIPGVRYVDRTTPGIQTHYIGYAPQPFITQVVAYGEADLTNGTEDVALAVELYNPNAPASYTGLANDVYALNLGQYALSINRRFESRFESGGTAQTGDLVKLGTLFPGARMNGQSFLSVIFTGNGGNTTLNGVAQGASAPSDQPAIDPVPDGNGKVVRVKLWRRDTRDPAPTAFDPSDTPLTWTLVDEVVVQVPAQAGANQPGGSTTPGGPAGPGGPGGPGLPSLQSWEWAAMISRDMQPESYFRANPLANNGRWRMLTSWQPNDPQYNAPYYKDYARQVDPSNPGNTDPTAPGPGGGGNQPSSGLPQQVRDWLNENPVGAPETAPLTFWNNGQGGPCVPLLTMNATSYQNGVPVPFVMNAGTGDVRPRSFPTVGFMLQMARFAHTMQFTVDQSSGNITAVAETTPMTEWLADQWNEREGTGSGAPGSYALDFGHMPIFDNRQRAAQFGYFDRNEVALPTAATPDQVELARRSENAGRLPWGLLVFDYFTTYDPQRNVDQQNGIDPGTDPLRIVGRLNVNAAPWYLLAGVPVINPSFLGSQNPTGANIGYGAVPPGFWSIDHGLMTAKPDVTLGGNSALNPRFPTTHWLSVPPGTVGTPAFFNLGPTFAESIAAYRDGMQMLPTPASLTPANPYQNPTALISTAHLRAGWTGIANPTAVEYRPATQYGRLRGSVVLPIGATTIPDISRPPLTQYGMMSVGELANARLFDQGVLDPSIVKPDATYQADFLKASALLTYLDSHWLTTRSNTFTLYATLFDRENPESSTRVQATIDRSNILPQLVTDYRNEPVLTTRVGVPGLFPVIRRTSAEPEVLVQRESNYFNARTE